MVRALGWQTRDAQRKRACEPMSLFQRRNRDREWINIRTRITAPLLGPERR